MSSAFTKPLKDWTEPTVTPGPGDYENNMLKTCKDERPHYTMRIKPKQEAKPRGVPVSISQGPAEYDHLGDPNDVTVQTAPWKQPVTRKVIVQKEVTPGPGDYIAEKAKDTTLTRNATYKLGLKNGNRGYAGEGFAGAGKSPGPAYYRQDGYIGKGLAKSISAKDLVISDRNHVKQSTTPGPGTYLKAGGLKHSASQPILERAPEYTWAAKQHTNHAAAGRRTIKNRRGNPIVGPGRYDPDPNQNHHRAPAYQLVGRSKISAWAKTEKTPGPNFMPSDKYSQLYTMQGKNDYEERTADIYKNPGPGTYEEHEAWNQTRNEKRYDKAKGKTFGLKLMKKQAKDPRKNGLTHDQPRHVASKSQKAASYTMQGRYKPRHEASQPGPGHYMVKSMLFTSTPKKRLC